MKNGNKARDVLGDSRQHYRTLRTNQMARFVTVPFKKKKIFRSTNSFEVTSERQGMCSTFFNRRQNQSFYFTIVLQRRSRKSIDSRAHRLFLLFKPFVTRLQGFVFIETMQFLNFLLQALGLLLKTCSACLFAYTSHTASTEFFNRSFVFGSLQIQQMKSTELFLYHNGFVSDGAQSAHGRANAQQGGKS